MNAPNDVQVGRRPAGTGESPKAKALADPRTDGIGRDVKPAVPTVAFTLNGSDVEASADETIIEVADRLGIAIPRLCYKPGYRPDGNCRACMWTMWSSAKCCVVKMKVRTGISVSPPPMPRSPARKPMAAPSASRTGTSETSIPGCYVACTALRVAPMRKRCAGHAGARGGR